MVLCLLLFVSVCASAKTAELRFHGNGGLINGYSVYTNSWTTGTIYDYSSMVFSNATKRLADWYYDKDLKSKVPLVGKNQFVVPTGKSQYDYYATWETDSYDVLYIDQNNSATNTQQMVASVAAPLRMNTFTYENHAFRGWDDDAAATEVEYTDGQTADLNSIRNYTRNAHLYAVWAYTYKVVFNPGAGSGESYKQTFVEDVAQKLEACRFTPPVGKIFDCWEADASHEYRTFSDQASIQENLCSSPGGQYKLTATWRALEYRIRFDANGGRGTAMPEVSCSYNTPKSLPKCSYSMVGHDFAGWATNLTGEAVYADQATVSNLTSEDGGVVTLYAKWRPIEYTVDFDANGGSGTMAAVKCAYGQSTVLPSNEYIRVGAAFRGWTTNGCETVVYEDGATVSNLMSVAGTFTLKALWSVNEYRVTFAGNGGSGEVAPMDCEYGRSYRFPSNDFDRVGYAFTGWTTNATAAAVYDQGSAFSNLTVAAGATVPMYAAWTPISYQIGFSANGGTGTMDPQSCHYDESVTLTSNAFVNAGHVFVGWAEDPAGIVKYSNGATVSNLTVVAGETFPLYAVWERRLHEYNAALDNKTMIFWEDDSVNRVSVYTDESAENSNCVRIVRGNGDTDAAGFHLRADSAGTLTFNWRVVDKTGSRGSKSWDLYAQDVGGSSNLWHYSYHNNETGTNMTDWARVQLTIPYAISDIYITFSAAQSAASEFSARVDKMCFEDGREEREWLEKYFPGQTKRLDDPNPIKGGRPLMDDYVAGTDPTNALSRFTTFIAITNGVPYVSWDPDLGSRRIYDIWGSANLRDWLTPTNSTHRFFKVTVRLP